jgi:hypothetical protein
MSSEVFVYFSLFYEYIFPNNSAIKNFKFFQGPKNRDSLPKILHEILGKLFFAHKEVYYRIKSQPTRLFHLFEIRLFHCIMILNRQN